MQAENINEAAFIILRETFLNERYSLKKWVVDVNDLDSLLHRSPDPTWDAYHLGLQESLAQNVFVARAYLELMFFAAAEALRDCGLGTLMHDENDYVFTLTEHGRSHAIERKVPQQRWCKDWVLPSARSGPGVQGRDER